MKDDPQRRSDGRDLVVIGSSAGGINALSVLLGSLPADFPAPIVVAQHIDPDRPSQLDSILSRATPLTVEMLHGTEKLEPGKIYLVPANRHVAIHEAKVALEGDHGDRPRPSVDLLLSTAAASYGERLIAVILTGSGADGANGAVEVKRAGGTVIIQNPATARFPSMPLSLPPTAVDHVADLEAIGPLLYELLTSPQMPQAGERPESALPAILDLLNHQANIDFRPYKAATIIRRITRRMTVTRTRSMTEYAAYIQSHPEEAGELVSALLINVTQFFRDPDVFAYLRHDILPLLIERARAEDHVLRFWCAGCATGEEAYSLAMILADMLSSELSEWSIKIFATDLDAAAINYARGGVYPENALRDLPDDFRERFFERMEGGKGHHVTKILRQMVIFGEQDVTRSPPFPRIDLVLCRNVLIYFTPELQEYVLNQFAFSLRPRHGYLLLGKAETIRPRVPLYEIVSKQWHLYRCSSDNVGLLRTRNAHGISHGRGTAPVQQPLQGGDGQKEEPTASLTEMNQLRRASEMLLRALPVGVAVIDRSYRLISANAAARRLLGLRELSLEQDFLHSARGMPYAQLRGAIDSVFRQRSPVTLPEVELEDAIDTAPHALSLSFVYMQSEPAAPDLVMISVTDVTEQVQIRRQLETAQAQQAATLAELEASNKRLNDANRDLLDANEQLQVSNEELMLTQEELQATIEVFETTNEELQASNEELETSNEELQATNEELETTNEELQASMNELQTLTDMLNREEKRLITLVEAAPFYIIALDGPDLIVESIDRRFASEQLQERLIGQPFEQVSARMWHDGHEIVDLAYTAYQRNETHITPRIPLRLEHEEREHPFVFTVVPARDAHGYATGVILYATDETLQQQREVALERDRLSAIFQHTSQVALALFDARTAELLVASPRYLDFVARLTGIDRGGLIGRQWRELPLNPSPERADDLWNRVIQARSGQRVPELSISAPGDERETVWDWTVTPIIDPDRPETVNYVLAAAVEITEQVEARHEIERVDRIKDEFLTLASHELRTPLTSLIGYAHIMEHQLSQDGAEAPSTDPQLARYVTIFNSQLQRMQRLVEDLVDVSRLQSGRFELKTARIDLARVIEQAVAEAQALTDRQQIRVTLPPDGGPLLVNGDRQRLIQVMLNLLQNAVTYASDSQFIDLRLSSADGTDAKLAQIEVQDYGQGMKPEDQASLFTRFYQIDRNERRSHGGLGLGLFISKQIVEQHGGTIAVDSAVGKGTTFTIRLPLSDELNDSD